MLLLNLLPLLFTTSTLWSLGAEAAPAEQSAAAIALLNKAPMPKIPPKTISLFEQFFQSLTSNVNNVNMPSFLAAMKPAPCVKTCMPDFYETLPKVLQLEDTKALANLKMDQVCSRIEETKKCMDRLAGRCTESVFDLVTNTFRYMCIDQREEMEAALPCFKAEATAASARCNQQCGLDKTIGGTAREDSKLVNYRDIASNTLFAMPDMNPVCKSSFCVMDCMQHELDDKCQGSTEHFIKAVFGGATGSGSKAFDGLSQMLISIMPDQCRVAIRDRMRSMIRQANAMRSLKTAASAPKPASLPAPFEDAAFRSDHPLNYADAPATLSCRLYDAADALIKAPDMREIAAMLRDEFFPALTRDAKAIDDDALLEADATTKPPYDVEGNMPSDQENFAAPLRSTAGAIAAIVLALSAALALL